MAGIVYSDYYLPQNYYSVEDILRVSERREAKNEEFCAMFIEQSRLKKIHVEKEKCRFEIYIILLDQFFDRSEILPNEISHIIYITSNSLISNKLEKECVYIPYLLQAHYGMESINIIELHQECITSLQAIEIANSLVNSRTATNVMILSMSYGFKMEERFIGTTIVGDGAGLMVIGERNFRSEIIDTKSVANGEYSYYKYKKTNRKIGNMVIVRKGAEVIKSFLDNNRLTIDGIKMIIPQNLNYIGYYVYAKLLEIPMEKIYLENIPLGGHLADVDTIRNYADVVGRGNLNHNDNFILYASGYINTGMDTAYSTVLLKYIK